MSSTLKYALIGGAVLLVAGIGIYFAMHNNKASAFNCSGTKSNHTIVAFGDSLVAGYGASEGQSFVDDLSTALHTPIQNQGVSGDTTEMALVRINTVLEAKPGLVILLIGGNDALQKKPIEETMANIDNILAKLSAAQIDVVLVGVQGGFLSDPYADMFTSLSKKYHTAYVPSILSGIIGHDELMSDQVHPNAAGYQKIADKILPVVRDWKSCII
jgi:acyl-CoA thioesterase-1